jgi:hypothetical protein
MRKLSKASTAVAASAALVLTGGVAYAYWTTSGSGTGSASTGDSSTADKIALAQVGTLTGFYPGSTPQTVLVQATNPAAYSQRVGEVTVTVAATATCAASNWTVVNTPDDFGVLGKDGSATDQSAAAGIAVATVQLVDSASNQDGCKSVSPDLLLVSAAGE